MFKRNVLYKHVNNTDVALEFLGIQKQYEDGLSVVGNWVNIVHKPAVIRQYQVVFIKNEQIPNWKEFVPGVSSRKG